MKRLAIISTHPIQYNVPWFRRLAAQEGVEVCVFYTWHADEKAKYDPHFDREIAWDIPLLNGYDYHLVAPRPTVEQKTFWNPCFASRTPQSESQWELGLQFGAKMIS